MKGSAHLTKSSNPSPVGLGSPLSASPGRIPILGVAGRLRAEHAEALEIVERQLETVEVEQAVEEHRRVTVRQDEAVAQHPVGIRRVESEVRVPQLECETLSWLLVSVLTVFQLLAAKAM